MPGGPLQFGWGLLAEIECFDETSLSLQHAEICLQEVLRAHVPAIGFVSGNRTEVDDGAALFLLAVLRRTEWQLGSRIREELRLGLASVLRDSETRALSNNGSSLYRWFGAMLGRLEPSHAPFVAFPFYGLLGDLFSRHWLFGWLRDRFAQSFSTLVPSGAAWLEAGARRAVLLRESRNVLAFCGLHFAERRRNSLANEILSLQSPNGSWAWSAMGTSIALVALRLLGTSREDSNVRRGLTYIRELRTAIAGELPIQSWARASTWDTATVAQSLLAGSDAVDSSILEAGALFVRSRQLASGETEFDLGVGTPDNDSTAATLTFLARVRSDSSLRTQSLTETAAERLLESLLANQTSGGGWSFSRSVGWAFSGRRPPAEIAALLFDFPSPDITARALLALAAARQLSFLDIRAVDRIDAAVELARSYVRLAQQDNGSWWGRWSDSDLSVTAELLVALCAIQDDPTSPMIQKARTWLLKAVTEPARLAPVEAAWAAAAITATSTVRGIADDVEVLPTLEALARQADLAPNSPTRSAYPVVYRSECYAAPDFDRARTLLALRFLSVTLRRGLTNARREILWGCPRVRPSRSREPRDLDLAERFQAIRFGALWLGGRPEDIGQRIVTHYGVYRDSRRNFTFPLLALHGAGWAYGYFRLLSLLLGPYATLRHPISSQRRDQLRKMLNRAMDGFKFANRRVLADTFANYHFSKRFGQHRGADRVLPQPLISQLNALHQTTRNAEMLTPNAKAKLYSDSFGWEQANSVWPMVERTIRDVNDPISELIAFRPLVRFAYFRGLELLVFSDFTRTEERIRQGWKAYRIAERLGWAATEQSIGKFNFIPVDLVLRSEVLIRWSTQLAEIDRMPPDPE